MKKKTVKKIKLDNAERKISNFVNVKIAKPETKKSQLIMPLYCSKIINMAIDGVVISPSYFEDGYGAGFHTISFEWE